MTSPRRRALAWLAAAGAALGCSDSPPTDPGDRGPVPGTFTVALASVAADAQPVVFVSLPTGSFPDGVLARLRVEATGLTTVAPIVDGGFDPVALSAIAGDTIAIAVVTSDGLESVSLRIEVKPKTPLIIVRTVPPRRRRDVPLNARIAVIFSEPVDPTSLTSAAVHLRSGGDLVEGALEFTDATRIGIAFVPARQLAALTDYELVVTPAVRDGGGLPLTAPASVPFTTGTTATQVVSVVISPAELNLVRGDWPSRLSVNVVDGRGNALYGRVVTWWSSDSTVVSVSNGYSNSGTMYAVALGGPVTITATTGNVSGQAQVTVVSSSPVASVVVQPDSARIAAGASFLPAVLLYDSRGRLLQGPSVAWSSSDPTVAAVGETGLVIGVSQGGPVTITATSEGKSGRMRITVTPPVTFASMTLGGSHSCSITRELVSYCWGDGTFAQLGNRQGESWSPAPTLVLGGLSFVSLTAGAGHTCGLSTSGVAYCWGRAYSGELGIGSDVSGSEGPYPGVPVLGGLTFTQLSAGGNHTCGLTSAGAAWCWGANTDGQLGDGTRFDRFTPVAVAGAPPFVTLESGGSHTCGLTNAGFAYCWGRNWSGQLGDGTETMRVTPTAVAGNLVFAALTAGEAHNCGLLVAGGVTCWGLNDLGQVGDGSQTNRVTPVPVAASESFVMLAAGAWHSCALTAAGAAFCWGANASGQLGNGGTQGAATPTRVIGGLSFAAIDGGGAHTCGLTSAGSAYCWGRNNSGQLGSGAGSWGALVPVGVVGVSP